MSFNRDPAPQIELPDPQRLPSASEEQYVLVTGGLGYIGSHTAWELLKAGHNTIIVDNLSNSYKHVLQNLQKLVKEHYSGQSNPPHLDFHEVDYRETTAMKAILSRYFDLHTPKRKITSVIHFAAFKSASDSLAQPLAYYSNNVAGLIDFLTLLSSFSIKTLVFSSSATVYGELATHGGRLREELAAHTSTTWVDDAGQAQTTLGGCTGLTSPYARTKWMSEAILSDLAASDHEWTIFALRYFNPVGCDGSGLLGEDPRGTPNNLMPLVVRVLEGNMEELSVFGDDWETGDGTAVRDFIHVSDLARGHVDAIRAETCGDVESGFHAVNLGTGCGSSVRQVLDTMQALSGKEIKTRVVGRREGDVGLCIADPTKARRMLGWVPVKTLEDSCGDICKYLEV